MRYLRGSRRKLFFTITMVLVAFAGFSIDTSLPAQGLLICDSDDYVADDTEDNCTSSCRKNGGEAACNAKFGYLDNGSPCADFLESYVHWSASNGDGTCQCIMDCEVHKCRDCTEQCDDPNEPCPM